MELASSCLIMQILICRTYIIMVCLWIYHLYISISRSITYCNAIHYSFITEASLLYRDMSLYPRDIAFYDYCALLALIRYNIKQNVVPFTVKPQRSVGSINNSISLPHRDVLLRLRDIANTI